MKRFIAIPLLIMMCSEVLHAVPNVAMLYRIQSFSKNDTRIPPGSQCEKILLDASDLLGRSLDYAEIEAHLDRILAEVKESLQPKARPYDEIRMPGASDPPRWCFVGDTSVWTPLGERWIEDLRPGDEVYSYDLAAGRVVINTVAKVRPTPDQEYGRLVDLPRQIDVTARHRFLSGLGLSDEDFAAIGDLAPEDRLYGVNTNDSCARELTPVRRGRWIPQPAPATVHELSLVGEPRNYFVEGILVHNIKW